MFSKPSNKPEVSSSSSAAAAAASSDTTTNLSTTVSTISHAKYLPTATLNGLPNDAFGLILGHLGVKDAYRLSNVSKITRAKINWNQFSFINRAAYVETQRALATAPKILKVLLFGDSALKRSVNGTSISTIGIDFVTVPFEKYKVQLWDTAGQERFKTITWAYIRGAHAVVLFAATQAELQELSRKIAGFQNDVHIVIAHPEGVSLDTTGLKVDSVFPLTATNCNTQQLVSSVVRSLERNFITQVPSPAQASSPANEPSQCRVM